MSVFEGFASRQVDDEVDEVIVMRVILVGVVGDGAIAGRLALGGFVPGFVSRDVVVPAWASGKRKCRVELFGTSFEAGRFRSNGKRFG